MIKQILKRLDELKIIPVLAFDTVEDACFTAELLVENNLPVAEITFRTKNALACIEEVSKQFPEMLVGAGTVLNAKDLDAARSAGAKFAVAPGGNEDVIKHAVDTDFPFFPGICNPSDIEKAYSLGVEVLKFFPAEAMGGIKTLKSIAAPYKHLGLSYIPTGGIHQNNINTYLKLPEVVACGGTWIINKDDLKARKRAKIADTIKRAVEGVK